MGALHSELAKGAPALGVAGVAGAVQEALEAFLDEVGGGPDDGEVAAAFVEVVVVGAGASGFCHGVMFDREAAVRYEGRPNPGRVWCKLPTGQY